MRFVILLFLAVLYISLNTYAQERFSFGPKLGFNIGAPLPIGNVPEGAKGSPIAGHNLGLFFNYSIDKHFSFQLEALYNRKGAKFTTPIDSIPYTDRIPLPGNPDIVFNVETFFNGKAEGAFDNYYFELPLFVNLHFNDKWSINAGAYYGWLTETQTHALATGTAGYDPKIRVEPIDFAENTRKYDWGYMLGGQYSFKNHISINIRLSYGTQSIFVDGYDKIDYSLNNLFAQFAATYSFYPKKWFKKKTDPFVS